MMRSKTWVARSLVNPTSTWRRSGPDAARFSPTTSGPCPVLATYDRGLSTFGRCQRSLPRRCFSTRRSVPAPVTVSGGTLERLRTWTVRNQIDTNHTQRRAWRARTRLSEVAACHLPRPTRTLARRPGYRGRWCGREHPEPLAVCACLRKHCPLGSTAVIGWALVNCPPNQAQGSEFSWQQHPGGSS